jgi:hypothetical protein
VNISTVCYARIHRTSEALALFNDVLAPVERTGEKMRRAEIIRMNGEVLPLRDTDRRDETLTILAEIYNWFTEGFDTADLKDAKALLDELSDRKLDVPGCGAGVAICQHVVLCSGQGD